MTLQEALAALGDTPVDVLYYMREHGIRGRNFSTSTCPVAEYLIQCGFKNVSAGSCEIVVSGETIPTPSYIERFMYYMDLGCYPELILREE